MEKIPVSLIPNEHLKPCLQCGNNTEFIFCSTKITESYYQLHLVCKCGYDPTEYDHSARGEDVPSDKFVNRLTAAMWYWTRAVEAADKKH